MGSTSIARKYLINMYWYTWYIDSENLRNNDPLLLLYSRKIPNPRPISADLDYVWGLAQKYEEKRIHGCDLWLDKSILFFD